MRKSFTTYTVYTTLTKGPFYFGRIWLIQGWCTTLKLWKRNTSNVKDRGNPHFLFTDTFLENNCQSHASIYQSCREKHGKFNKKNNILGSLNKLGRSTTLNQLQVWYISYYVQSFTQCQLVECRKPRFLIVFCQFRRSKAFSLIYVNVYHPYVNTLENMKLMSNMFLLTLHICLSFCLSGYNVLRIY